MKIYSKNILFAWMLILASVDLLIEAQTFKQTVTSPVCNANIDSKPRIGTGCSTYEDIEVPDDCLITDMSVSVNIEHANIGELFLALFSPSNGEFGDQLFGEGTCGSSKNMNLTFTGNGTSDVTCGTPVQGIVQPVDSFDEFLIDSNARGNWTLSITDSTSENDGVLNCWSIDFTCSPLCIGLEFVADSQDCTEATAELFADHIYQGSECFDADPPCTISRSTGFTLGDNPVTVSYPLTNETSQTCEVNIKVVPKDADGDGVSDCVDDYVNDPNQTSYYCPGKNFIDVDGDFKCSFSATPDCNDQACAEERCEYLIEPSNDRRLDAHVAARTATLKTSEYVASGLRSRKLQANCPAGNVYDPIKRGCIDQDECISEQSPCPLDEGSYCVDHDAEVRFECGCKKQFRATGYPTATTSTVYNGKVVDAIIEGAFSETGELYMYTVPLQFRPEGCERIATAVPSPAPTTVQVEATIDQCLEDFGRSCVHANGEYCGKHIEQDNTTTFACLCLPAWEKILGLHNRGCKTVNKCETSEWNNCDKNAVCKDLCPGLPEPVLCICQEGYVGGGRHCDKIEAPSPIPSKTPSSSPTNAVATPSPVRIAQIRPRPVPVPVPAPVPAPAPVPVTCPDGQVNVDNVCKLPRRGATFNSSNNMCEFKVCPQINDGSFIEANRFNIGSGRVVIVCTTIVRPTCDVKCATDACTANGGFINMSSGRGSSWDDSIQCNFEN